MAKLPRIDLRPKEYTINGMNLCGCLTHKNAEVRPSQNHAKHESLSTQGSVAQIAVVTLKVQAFQIESTEFSLFHGNGPSCKYIVILFWGENSWARY